MKKDFNILIVEDELMIAEMTKKMLIKSGYNVVGLAKNYNQALTILDNEKDIDLIILDINLSDLKDGIDVAKDIESNYEIPFIYLTSYSDPKTVTKASTTAPVAYLLKPYTRGDLYTTIEMIRARKNENGQAIMVKDGHLGVKIQAKDIFFIKSDDNYLELITKKKKYIIRKSLEKFLIELNDPNFIRIHRSYAANLLKIEAVNGQYILIQDYKCPISRKHKEELMAQFAKVR